MMSGTWKFVQPHHGFDIPGFPRIDELADRRKVIHRTRPVDAVTRWLPGFEALSEDAEAHDNLSITPCRFARWVLTFSY